jgi:hypothetical protein
MGMNLDAQFQETGTELEADFGEVLTLKGDKGDPGSKGDKGDPGYTPVKGVDYFTEDDKAEIVEAVAQNVLPECSNALKATASGETVRIDDVSPLAHIANVAVRGKNLIPFPYILDTSTGGGVTYTAHDDGGITGSGTASAQHNFTLYYGKLLADGVITISLSGNYTNIVGVLLLKDKSGTTVFNKNIDPVVTLDISAYPTAVKMELLIKRKSNIAVSGTVYPQLEEGDTATEYVPYINPANVTVIRYGADKAENLQTFTPSADGSFEIPSLSPTMTLEADTDGVTIECEYNQDTSKAMGNVRADIKELDNAVAELAGGGTGENYLTLKDQTTGKKYKVYVNNGKLTMTESED